MEDFRSSAETSKARLNPLHGGRQGQKIAFLASAGWIIEILIFIAKIFDSNIYDGYERELFFSRGIGKKWYRKKVSEPVSEKFGTGKSLRTGIEKIWYREF